MSAQKFLNTRKIMISMKHEDILILLTAGVFLGLDFTNKFFFLFSASSLVSAYILVRFYDSQSDFHRWLGIRIALFLFLLSSVLLLYLIHYPHPFEGLGVLLILIPVLFLNGIGSIICVIIIIYSFTVILQNKGDLQYKDEHIEDNTDLEEKNNPYIEMEKENFAGFFLYIMGGFILVIGTYFLFLTTTSTHSRGDFIYGVEQLTMILVSVWATMFLALSSKHKLADVGCIVFGGILIPFVFYFPHVFTNLSVESIMGITRLLFGIFFTLILLGYDTRRIPREGIIEYGIYGMSFIPLVSSFIFVTPYISHPHITMIFALLILLKIIFTAGYVYKRIGIE